MRFLGALRYRRDRSLDVHRYYAGAMQRARRRAADGAPPRPFSSQGGQIDSMVPAAQRRRRARSGNLPLCGPFLRYEVERCLPDASLV